MRARPNSWCFRNIWFLNWFVLVCSRLLTWGYMERPLWTCGVFYFSQIVLICLFALLSTWAWRDHFQTNEVVMPHVYLQIHRAANVSVTEHRNCFILHRSAAKSPVVYNSSYAWQYIIIMGFFPTLSFSCGTGEFTGSAVCLMSSVSCCSLVREISCIFLLCPWTNSKVSRWYLHMSCADVTVCAAPEKHRV